MTRERKKTIWDQLPNAVSGMRSPLSSAQQARSKMLWGRLRTGLPLRTAEQSPEPALGSGEPRHGTFRHRKCRGG